MDANATENVVELSPPDETPVDEPCIDPISFSSDVQSALDASKNKDHVVCSKCGSIVLRSGDAHITKKQTGLPAMHKKSDQGDFPVEEMDEFWVVNSMYAFENVGFSNTIGTIKYLVCADCEEGPIGFHDTLNKTAFYVSASRITYRPETVASS